MPWRDRPRRPRTKARKRRGQKYTSHPQHMCLAHDAARRRRHLGGDSATSAPAAGAEGLARMCSQTRAAQARATPCPAERQAGAGRATPGQRRTPRAAVAIATALGGRADSRHSARMRLHRASAVRPSFRSSHRRRCPHLQAAAEGELPNAAEATRSLYLKVRSHHCLDNSAKI